MNVYEAMFLMDPALSSDWPAAETEVNRILERAEAKILGMKKWDERKLAYTIGQHRRGLYVLCFFEASPEKIAGIERDVQLSEKALRILVFRKDKMQQEAIEKALSAAPPPKAPARGDDWRGGRGPGRDFERRPRFEDADRKGGAPSDAEHGREAPPREGDRPETPAAKADTQVVAVADATSDTAVDAPAAEDDGAGLGESE